MAKIAIFVNTFLRDDLIQRFVESCEKYVPDCRLYITDNGRITKEKLEQYRELESRGHFIHTRKFNYWWRKSFNEKLFSLADEEYILKIDDDFIFDENSNIERFIEILDHNKDIGLVGGQVWHVRNNRKSDYIFKVVGIEGDDVFRLKVLDFDDKDYIDCDYVPDFWMARREIFVKDGVRMEENMKPAEGAHELFFRKIYLMEKDWKIVYTDKVRAIHEKSSNSEEYKQYRYGGYNPKTYKKNIKMARE